MESKLGLVLIHVIFQRVGAGRPIRAIGTSIRLFSSVGSDVCLKVLLLCAGVGTVGACKWLFPSVRPYVPVKVSDHTAGILTVGTLVHLAIGV